MDSPTRKYNPATAANIEKARRLQAQVEQAKAQRDLAEHPPSSQASSVIDFSADPSPRDDLFDSHAIDDALALARREHDEERIRLEAGIFDQLDGYSFDVGRPGRDHAAEHTLSSDNAGRQRQYEFDLDLSASDGRGHGIPKRQLQNGVAGSYDFSLDGHRPDDATATSEGRLRDFDPGDYAHRSRDYSTQDANSELMRKRLDQLIGGRTGLATLDGTTDFDNANADATYPRRTATDAAPSTQYAPIDRDRDRDRDRPSASLNEPLSYGNPFLVPPATSSRPPVDPDHFLVRHAPSPPHRSRSSNDVDDFIYPDHHHRRRTSDFARRDSRERPANPTPSTRAAVANGVGRRMPADGGLYAGEWDGGYNRRGSDRREYMDIVGDESFVDEDDVGVAGRYGLNKRDLRGVDNGSRSQGHRSRNHHPSNDPDLTVADRIHHILGSAASESFHVGQEAFDLLSSTSSDPVIDIDIDPVIDIDIDVDVDLRNPLEGEDTINRAPDTPSQADFPQHRQIRALPGDGTPAMLTAVRALQDQVARLQEERAGALTRAKELEADNETYRQLLYREQVKAQYEGKGKGPEGVKEADQGAGAGAGAGAGGGGGGNEVDASRREEE
ncbi:hypothetical protein BC938DRAFT_474257, partial [Jimgerdemannia flammicorona]